MVTLRGTAVAGAVAMALGGPLAAGILAVSSSSTAWAATTSSASTSTSCTKADVVIVSRNSNLTKVSVKLAAGSENVSCDVSLHSYETQGATWATSGQQKAIGFATVHLTTTAQTLSVPGPECFGQTELVIGTKRFDGVDGPLPHYPNGVFASNTVLAIWHGGKACVSPSPSVLPEQTSVTPTPSVSPTSTVSPSPSVLPTSTVSPSVSPSPSPSVLGLTLTRPPQQPTLPFTGAPVLAEVSLGLGLLGSGTLCGLYAWRRRAGSASN